MTFIFNYPISLQPIRRKEEKKEMKTKNEKKCFLDWYKERRKQWTFVKEIKQKLLKLLLFL